MQPFSQPPALPPPLSAEFDGVMKPVQAGAKQMQTPWKLFRASDGTTRIDSGQTSVITGPNLPHTISLDHLKQEARLTPKMPQLQMPGMPPVPQMPKLDLPKPPALTPQPVPTGLQELGKRMIHGYEAEGKRLQYKVPEIAPPPPPVIPKLKMPAVPKTPQAKLPQIPKVPQAPNLAALGGIPGVPKLPTGLKTLAPPQPPGLPAAPAPPGVPAVPQVVGHAPQTMEVWTANQLQLPMASKVTGPAGEQTSVCKKLTVGEPSPALFQIPPGYKLIQPKLPAMPKIPHVPKLQVPKLPL